MITLASALQVSAQMELLAEELQNTEVIIDGDKADHLLHVHQECMLHMRSCTFEVLQRGQDLRQVDVNITL